MPMSFGRSSSDPCKEKSNWRKSPERSPSPPLRYYSLDRLEERVRIDDDEYHRLSREAYPPLGLSFKRRRKQDWTPEMKIENKAYHRANENYEFQKKRYEEQKSSIQRSEDKSGLTRMYEGHKPKAPTDYREVHPGAAGIYSVDGQRKLLETARAREEAIYYEAGMRRDQFDRRPYCWQNTDKDISHWGAIRYALEQHVPARRDYESHHAYVEAEGSRRRGSTSDVSRERRAREERESRAREELERKARDYKEGRRR